MKKRTGGRAGGARAARPPPGLLRRLPRPAQKRDFEFGHRELKEEEKNNYKKTLNNCAVVGGPAGCGSPGPGAAAGLTPAFHLGGEVIGSDHGEGFARQVPLCSPIFSPL